MTEIKEDLRKWFGTGGKGGVGGGGWDRYNTKGERIGKCARGKGEGKPKCLSKEKAAKMTKKQRAAAVRRKRRQDPVADRKGKGGKPVMVSNKIKKESAMTEYTEKPLSEINIGAIIVKDSGCVYQIKEMHEMSPNVRYIIFEDSYGNYLTEYSSVNKQFYVKEDLLNEKSAAWQRKEGKNEEGGLNAAGRKSYERENPGSDLKAPVSAEQAKKSKGGKAAKRRKSFCARMGGMKGPMKDEKGRPTRKALALRKWDCGSLNSSYEPEHGDDIIEAPTLIGKIRTLFTKKNRDA